MVCRQIPSCVYWAPGRYLACVRGAAFCNVVYPSIGGIHSDTQSPIVAGCEPASMARAPPAGRAARVVLPGVREGSAQRSFSVWRDRRRAREKERLRRRNPGPFSRRFRCDDNSCTYRRSDETDDSRFVRCTAGSGPIRTGGLDCRGRAPGARDAGLCRPGARCCVGDSGLE